MAQVLQPDKFRRQADESGDAEHRGASSSASASTSFSTSLPSTFSAPRSSPASPSSPSLSSSSAPSDHSPTTVTSSAPSSHRATRPCDEPSVTQRDFVLGICTLDEMRKLSQCQSGLGDLTANSTHTVLIDVRPPYILVKEKKYLKNCSEFMGFIHFNTRETCFDYKDSKRSQPIIQSTTQIEKLIYVVADATALEFSGGKRFQSMLNQQVLMLHWYSN